MPSHLSLGQSAMLACLLEVTAPKPGNVHRSADFEDMGFVDFAASAVAIGPIIDQAANRPLGQLVLDSVGATQALTQANTNLGLILLLAPLAKAATISGCDAQNYRVDQTNLALVLSRCDSDDCSLVYEAIRLAAPGGLGRVKKQDVANENPNDLIEAMKLAQDRDLVARQYANGFEELFEVLIPSIRDGLEKFEKLTEAIVWAHVKTMAEFPDSLIARKCGDQIALKSSLRAKKTIDEFDSGRESYLAELSELDFWLRSDGNKRNPGTTADLIGAALFTMLVNGEIESPFF